MVRSREGTRFRFRLRGREVLHLDGTVIAQSEGLHLQREEIRVQTVFGHQFSMSSLFSDLPVVEYVDVIGHPHAGETMGDQDHGSVDEQVPHGLEQCCL